MNHRDTMRFQQAGRPGVCRRDFSNVPAAVVADRINLRMNHDKAIESGKPEHDAISFYLLNHAFAELSRGTHPDRPLNADQMELTNAYHATLADAGTRMFYYLVLICTREARHIVDVSQKDKVIDQLKTKYPMDFLFGLNKGGGAVKNFFDSVPEVSFGTYTWMLEEAFFKANWSGGFGGEAWGNVARVLRQVAHGEFTIQMMLDVGFALCHNGGPIFNKGMLYSHYDMGELTKILDCQRAGQIPEMVRNGECSLIEQRHLHQLDDAQQALGTEFCGTHVDWYAVEAAGAVGNWDAQKSHQLNKYGPSPLAAKIEAEKLAAKEQAEKEKAAEAAKAKALHQKFLKEHIEIMPEVYLKKVKVR